MAYFNILLVRAGDGNFFQFVGGTVLACGEWLLGSSHCHCCPE